MSRVENNCVRNEKKTLLFAQIINYYYKVCLKKHLQFLSY